MKGSARYSYHQWGEASDIFVDFDPEDEWMDDLNGDGKINLLDAEIVYDIVLNLKPNPGYEGLQGGLSMYRTRGDHGPFVHVDVRGTDVTL